MNTGELFILSRRLMKVAEGLTTMDEILRWHSAYFNAVSRIGE